MNREEIKYSGGRFSLRFPYAESYFKNSLLLYALQHNTQYIKGKLLDLGCGNKPYYDLYSRHCRESVGCDVPYSLHRNGKVEVMCRAEEIDSQFPPDEFDTIICTEVLEHTDNDRKVVSNIAKVLKPGGMLIISAPFTYVLHEEPHDYRRYTAYGLTGILGDHGFNIVSVTPMGGTLSSGFFIFYYSFTKGFLYFFKKIGLESLRNTYIMKFLISLPEFIMYKVYSPFFRKKLNAGSAPGRNELFSSTGYFVIAEKPKLGKC